MEIYNNKIVKQVINLTLIIIVINTFFYLSCFNYVDAIEEQQNDTTKTDRSQQIDNLIDSVLDVPVSSVSNEDEANDSGITTKIYKSSSPPSELLDEGSNLNAATDNDILSKNELVKRKKSKKANSELIENNKTCNAENKNTHTALPWLILISLALSLGIIFSVLIRKKV